MNSAEQRSHIVVSVLLPSSVPRLIISLLLLLSCTTSAASFSCINVTASDEKAICADRELGEKDVRMATTYAMLRDVVLMGGRDALQDEQNDWLQKRQACGANTICLSHLYDERTEELYRQYKQILISMDH